MQTNIGKNIEKIAQELSKINKLSKSIIKYGTQASLALLSLGTLIIILNQTLLSYDAYLKFVGTLIIKNSFIILAEAIIGGLLIDFITKRS